MAQLKPLRALAQFLLSFVVLWFLNVASLPKL